MRIIFQFYQVLMISLTALAARRLRLSGERLAPISVEGGKREYVSFICLPLPRGMFRDIEEGE